MKTYFQKKISKTPHIIFFDNNLEKLDEIEQHMCDGLLTEHELATALKEMKNKKKSWVRRTYLQQSFTNFFGTTLNNFILTR